jgi:HlyD family secretion protein
VRRLLAAAASGMKAKTVVLLLIAAGAAGAIAWKVLRPAAPTPVVTARAERVALLRSLVSATGEIRAKEFVDIQTEVAGLITEVLVREGDTVQRGDVLLRLEDLQLRAEEDAARAQLGASEADARNAELSVATAEANLAGERTMLANARVEAEQARTSRDRAASSFQRKKELFEANLIGQEEYEVSAAESRLSGQRLEVAEARIEQAEASVRAAETRIEAAKAMRDAAERRTEAQRAAVARAADMTSRTVLRAPLTGRITALHVEKGERAVPGFQANPVATLMTIADMSVIEAEIRVDEADIVAVEPGAEATVEVDAIRDQKFAGVVTEIGQSPIQATGTGQGSNQQGREFKVVVRITAPPPSLRPGFTATAEIVTATRRDCLVIPLQALTAREVELDGEGHYVPPPMPTGDEVPPLRGAQRQVRHEVEGVFLLVDGRARFRPVKTGITGDMDIEVLEGLAEGEEVVIGPFQALRKLEEWDRVEIDRKRQASAILVRRR